jgi:hypothetical protein
MSGARTAKASFLQRIADAYGIDVLWLMGYDVPKYKDAPVGADGGISEDRAYLLDKVSSLSDEEVRVLRGIVDQVLSLRGK